MKSNIQKVYSKLPKTELSKVELGTQKVDLGLLDDFIKSSNNPKSKVTYKRFTVNYQNKNYLHIKLS